MKKPVPSFEAVGRAAVTHPWYVIAAWAAALVALLVLARTVGGEFGGEFKLPGTESQRARDLLAERFPARGGDSADLVFQAEAGIDDPAIRPRLEAIVVAVRALPGVTEVASPFDTGAISSDGTIAFATVRYPDTDDDGGAAARALVAEAERAGGNGLRIETGGEVIEDTERQGPGGSEIIGIAAAAIILLVAFGSVVAMGVPILAAIFSLGAALTALTLLTRVLGLMEFTPAFAAMIGLGVGIDYALLVITRYRESLHHGHSVDDAAVIAVNTAGRSVAFAGTVVIIAMLGLLVVGVPFVGALGVASAIVVSLSVLTALTLLPATLKIIGHRVDALSIPFLRSTETGHDDSVWFRLSVAIQRRPWAFIIGGTAVLLVLAVPLLSMETNFSDAGSNPESFRSRRAYDLLSEGFGAGFNGPLVVVADVREGGAERIDALAESIAQEPGVARVMPPRFNGEQDTAVITVFPSTAPDDHATNDLVHALREGVIPAAADGTGADVYITGHTAATIDITDRINSRLPIFFAAVIGLSFVVLAMVFRSLAVPAKAALMNLLSIGAAYGVVVAIFQWGWLAGPLGAGEPGPIETFVPMMMFAILFGLSMDYEVFLVSRIHESYVKGMPNSRAVALGLSTTARVITSAALIMIAVFSSFVLNEERVIKEFGLGLAVAIFLDATVVRLLLVPALMETFGKWNWWMPAFLDRLLPRIDIEGSPEAEHGVERAPAEDAA